MTDRISWIPLLAEAVTRHKTLPPLPPGLTETEGYQLARRLAEAVAGDQAHCGLKAGLTDPRIQSHLGLKEAMLGHLYSNRRLEPGARLCSRGKAMIECELAVFVDAGGRPLSVAPALEFVNVDFARPEDLTPPNLAAINLGADAFMVGETRPWDELALASLDSARIQLYRENELLLDVPANTSLGGVAEASRWMLDKARRLGWPLGDETLLMTGTVGKPLAFVPGLYRADYGSFGSVSFTIDDQ
ncbi:hypothetical protein [Alloalcanivorax xenomutans]|jgi:2-keto-4-pentenoate hydratase|uniref:2-keto-4-pentenoate hydratase n=1 Tax=Alloalcanivorax xenomutans TaxID=1094342 RepID=A0A9Q3W632_9GAMM|nr:hypothetical protein [Alloalcanivorax xenomutans]ERS13057.1 hypothetical protein Q668_01900 [Alcanivorax sp. PN-3]MBA4720202.1 hypothetical protein [Alcanivorax sp.]ARB45774.1 hypothetical protein P40_10440 [Alloalcanivorax xenomutans]MCE7509209.1 hypothetical protein [Alloalcanivorax xenomutans]MCE7525175.1 hypothetical protein [Alloalcanivorax xenomutans]